MNETHVTVLDPAILINCSECGVGLFVATEEHWKNTGWTIWACTNAACESEGVTIRDIQLDEDEELIFIMTEAGSCLGYRTIISRTEYI